MKRSARHSLALPLLASVGCNFEEHPTVEMPEDPALLARARGTLVLSEGWHSSKDLQLISLPSLAKRTLDFEGEASAHSGIDASGRLALLYQEPTDAYPDGEPPHYVILVSVEDGHERVILERRGETGGTCEVSMAHANGRVAFLSRLHLGGYQYTPEKLDVWSEERDWFYSRELESSASHLRWLPDGSRLAFRDDDGVRVIDVETGADSYFGDASGALAAPEGDRLLLHRYGERLRWVDAEGDKVDGSPQVPGLLYQVIDVLENGLVLYEGLPTEGTEQRPTRAFLAGPEAQWTIKLADTASGAYATVVPYFGPGRVAYSPFELE